MRNLIVFILLTGLYILISSQASQWKGVYLFLLPIIVGVIGYQFTSGKPLIRRLLPTVVPLVALPATLFFMEFKVAFGYTILHSFLIGVIVVQLWELLLWLLKPITSKFGPKESK